MAETVAPNKVLTVVDFSVLLPLASYFPGLLPESSMEGFMLHVLLLPWLTPGNGNGVHDRLSWGRAEGTSKGEEGRGGDRKGGGGQ